MNHRNGDFPSTDFINKFSLSYQEWSMTGKTRYKVGLLDVEISFIFLLLYWIIGREVITYVMFKSVGYDTHI